MAEDNSSDFDVGDTSRQSRLENVPVEEFEEDMRAAPLAHDGTPFDSMLQMEHNQFSRHAK